MSLRRSLCYNAINSTCVKLQVGKKHTPVEFRKSVDSRDRGIQKVDSKGTGICACLSVEL